MDRLACRLPLLLCLLGFPYSILLGAGNIESGPAASDPSEPACPPGNSLTDEAPEIRALGPALFARYVIAACPLAGCAGDSRNQAILNRRKNRSDAPDATQIDSSVTLAALLAASRDDRQRWRPDVGARIVGHVRHVWQGGVESANCRTTDTQYRDTHIDLYLDAGKTTPDARRVVVEITPRIRALAAARGQDWSTAALKQQLIGHWIEVTGWTFFDADHCNEAANTIRAADCGGPGGGVWRQTDWEVHPVTSLRIVPAPAP